MEARFLQNAPMKNMFSSRPPRNGAGEPRENLGSVNMEAKPGGLYAGVQGMGGGGRPEEQEKPLNVDGFMNRLRKAYDWAPKLGIYAGRRY
jgi:hypothetical protein